MGDTGSLLTRSQRATRPPGDCILAPLFVTVGDPGGNPKELRTRLLLNQDRSEKPNAAKRKAAHEGGPRKNYMSTYPTPRLVVRLYENPKFGSRSGPKRTNRLVFNGSVEINEGRIHVDVATVEHMAQAVDPQAQHIELVLRAMAKQLTHAPHHETDVLVGQLKVVEPTNYVEGGLVINLHTRELKVFLYNEGKLAFCEDLELSRCRTPRDGLKSPNYIATNYELGLPVAPPDEAAHSKAAAMLDQMNQRSNPSSNTVVTADAVISILRSSAG